jgi:hypothetical protein
MAPDLDYRAIRKRVEAGIVVQKKRTRTVMFAVSVFIYALFMIIGWGMFLTTGAQNLMSAGFVDKQGDSILVGAMIMLSMAGAMGLLFQFISLAIESKRSEDRMRERLVAREINNEMLRMGMDEVEEHEKRKGMMRLTDDGELEEVLEDEAVQPEDLPLKQRR